MSGSENEHLEIIRKSLKTCPNFPKNGITFIDILGIFSNPTAHRALIDLILTRIRKFDTKIDAVVGLEARGFIFGPQIALELQVPFLPVRKHGKLPGKLVKVDYALEYGTDTIEMQVDILKSGTKILLVDDILATGGTLSAAQKLCAKLGYDVSETLVIIELLGLGGREKLANIDHFTTLFQYSQNDIEAIAARYEK
ncbi:unnamed protein product [Rotaria socialis]|uniref:Adenine phosphoribosyltransferase n=1 Tax=Rotaria socialis TaxID=392032 RepID=A0A820WN01_9BILA|nr:unnamed protein product [Rotaria socialis]CAF3430913.1 unnamed protein product [Rotaria socialis]CAF4281377.1 unnamed protein product [Rotaria socialis]CAF4520978.1 unnamed protein product [Rotaria socialis]